MFVFFACLFLNPNAALFILSSKAELLGFASADIQGD